MEHLGKPTRIMAPFWWFGGKGNLARTILPHIPAGKIYVEPYAGAASILFHRKPQGVEVLNDLHSEIVTIFRVLQDKQQFEELSHRLTWTLYSLDEFRKALEMEQAEGLSDVDRAWAFFVRQNQGFSGVAQTDRSWVRSLTQKAGTSNKTNSWRKRLACLEWWHDRLTRVQIDNRCALEAIRYWDSSDTVFYIDPPYIASTRKKDAYKHEQDDSHHRDLVEVLLGIEGQAVLSGYDHSIYEPLSEWRKVNIETACHAAGRIRGSSLQGKGAALKNVARIETLWIKEHDHRKYPLFLRSNNA